MTLIQALNVKLNTFGDLALHLIQMQRSCCLKAGTVVDVYDRYNEKQSIKSAQRTRRTGSLSSQKVFHVIEGRSIPDWKRFLGVDVNKQALLAFLGEYTTCYYS